MGWLQDIYHSVGVKAISLVLMSGARRACAAIG
jgi:hypothetical protein